MKENKRGLAFCLILSILILSQINLVQAAVSNSPNLIDSNLVDNANSGIDKVEEFSAEDKKGEYLSREWTDFLRKKGYLNWFYKMNPLWQFLFGQEFSISWAFITAIIIWIGVVSVYYQFGTLAFKDGLTSLAVAILTGAITTNLLTEKVIDQFSQVIKTGWNNFFFIFGLIVLFFIINALTKTVKTSIKKRIDKNRLNRIEEEVKGSYKDIHEGLNSMREGANS